MIILICCVLFVKILYAYCKRTVLVLTQFHRRIDFSIVASLQVGISECCCWRVTQIAVAITELTSIFIVSEMMLATQISSMA